MANVLVQDSSLSGTAAAIRRKNGTSTKYKPAQFAAAIDAIQTGAGLTLTVSVASGASVTATNGTDTVTGTSVGGTCVLSLPSGGTWTVTAAGYYSSTVVVQDNYPVTLEERPSIYGVEWDWTTGDSPSGVRTDDAASFGDPSPYVAGASNYGSPFDNLAPWKDMTRVTDSEAGEMVKIPKFWYKLTQSGNTLKVQISGSATDGYSVCPACMDRGDGAGERDYVLVGRYHCAASDYKSKTGEKPKAGVTQADFRTAIHNLGSKVYMMDFATRFTIWLLYIVEFANWNSQATIGKGCGNNIATENMGYTDSMPYHTGTTQNSRDTYGLGTQYRNLEGLWDNLYDRLTGCYFSRITGLMVEVNPANFAENSGGVSVGTPVSGWIAGLTVSTSGPFPCFINSKTDGGGEAAYVCDIWNISDGSPVVVVGGNYGRYGYFGMFFMGSASLSSTYASFGSRILKFP